jgi:hypothetical protein
MRPEIEFLTDTFRPDDAVMTARGLMHRCEWCVAECERINKAPGRAAFVHHFPDGSIAIAERNAHGHRARRETRKKPSAR